MDLERYTVKSREALERAQRLAHAVREQSQIDGVGYYDRADLEGRQNVAQK